MPVGVFLSTMPGGVTPLCNVCMVALCYDLSEEEYLWDKDFWDNWECKDCNPDYKGSLTRFRLEKETHMRNSDRNQLFARLRRERTDGKRIWGFKDSFVFLSNFYYVDSGVFGYRTSEHAYMAAKSTDESYRSRIRDCKTPGEAKRLGRQVKLRPDWEEIKLQVMEAVLRAKFKAGSDLAKKLLETGDRELVEGNVWHDNYWGDCGCPQCQNIPGQNHLGLLLMAVREVLRSGIHID